MQHDAKTEQMNVEDYVSWVLAAVATVVATLAGAVASLWKVNEARNSKQIEEMKAEIKDCKEDRDDLRRRLDEHSEESAAMRVRLAYLEREEKGRNGEHE